MSTTDSALLTVNFAMPISHDYGHSTGVIFHKWLPAGITEALHRKKGNFSAALWIDRDCLSSQPTTEEQISRWHNISVSQVKIKVEVRDVPIVLSNFIYDERESGREIHHGLQPGDPHYDELKREYYQLAVAVLSFTLEMYNRFIEYLRIEKGQFWLSRRRFDEDLIPSIHVESRATVKCGDRDAVFWAFNFPYNIKMVIGAADPYVWKSDWQKLDLFVSGNSRTNSVREFVSNAMFFAAAGYLRSAIAETTTALELAVANFSKNPNTTKLLQHPQTARVDLQNLGATVPRSRPKVNRSFIVIEQRYLPNGPRRDRKGC
jgi:hypothetical protein